MDRLSEEKQLNINKTFENQQKYINGHIIPIIQKSINKDIFPVDDGIIRHIIYEQHHHQREELLNRTRSETWLDIKKRWRHANSRCSDVSKSQIVCFMFLLVIFII
jgi:hypothetical protein